MDDAAGIDVEVLRLVVAKAHTPVLRNPVYPEVQSHDLTNTTCWRESTLVFMEGPRNSISEAQVQTRLSRESVQSVGIPTSANTLSRMLHT